MIMQLSLSDKIFLLTAFLSLGWLIGVLFQKQLGVEVTVLNNVADAVKFLLGALVGVYTSKGDKK